MVFERARGGRLAVDEKRLPGRSWEVAEPAEEFTSVGVRGELLQVDDFSFHRNVFAVDAQRAGTFEERASAGAFGLEAGEQHGVA